MGCTVTSAFERFMKVCVEGGVLVFPESGVRSFEVEARVLVDLVAEGQTILPWRKRRRSEYSWEAGLAFAQGA